MVACGTSREHLLLSLGTGPTIGADWDTEALTISIRAPTTNVSELFVSHKTGVHC